MNIFKRFLSWVKQWENLLLSLSYLCIIMAFVINPIFFIAGFSFSIISLLISYIKFRIQLENDINNMYAMKDRLDSVSNHLNILNNSLKGESKK